MHKNILLPQLALTMESVEVIGWLVKVGDRLNAGQPILEVESQKSVLEVPCPEPGYMRKFCVNKGETIGEKALLCIVTDTADEPLSDVVAAIADHASSANRPPRAVSTAATESDDGAIKAVPAARKLAKDLGIDLAAIKGSGPGGRIVVEDLQRCRKPTQIITSTNAAD